ncbi:hypothetical protein Y032_0348g3164 [Ancylostoma ceylanicum]|uniref:Mos1 transposase HTH domain-containing protein n=1 Tax=Ancylostoma ceylanicum TaxID=53326 RepID=A0A016RY01_9BILA|nr:hypothetical protein Y032_0348g3164 [Ancylostoma ceylanicum]
MDLKKKVYRANLLLQYRCGSTAHETHRFLLDSMGDRAPSRATCFIWYRRFRNGEESLGEAPRIGRPSTQKRSAVITTCEAQSSCAGYSSPYTDSKVHCARRPSDFRQSFEAASSSSSCAEPMGQEEAR